MSPTTQKTVFNTVGVIAAVCGAVSLTLSTDSLAADPGQPCELLTEDLVREAFELAADTVIEQDDNSSSRFPNCGYRWRIMSEKEQEEAEAANSAKMMENLKAGKSPNEGIDHNIPTHAQVRLTTAAFDNPEKAQSGLEGSKSFMIGRAEQKGREPTPWVPIEGVGDKAYYHGTQLSFAWDDMLIHLDISPQERAVELALKVMD